VVKRPDPYATRHLSGHLERGERGVVVAQRFGDARRSERAVLDDGEKGQRKGPKKGRERRVEKIERRDRAKGQNGWRGKRDGDERRWQRR
jgi:hypothetical protein